MMKRFLFLFIVAISINNAVSAQVRDSVTVGMPPYTDTICPGFQYTFWANQSSDTFHGVTFKWFLDGVFTGVTLDTFLTSAPISGDFVYCKVYFTNSFGNMDSSTSDTVFVYRNDTIPPNAIISLIVGNNPDCQGHLMTFEVYPINGGLNPLYQWYVNGLPVTDADSLTFSGIFADSSVIKCMLISNSPCAPFDTVFSNSIMVLRDSLSNSITISTRFDTICQGNLDTFTSVVINNGGTVYYQWYVDTTAFVGATGPMFILNSLNSGDSVYCIITTQDSCIKNKIQHSNVIHVFVKPILNAYLSVALTDGSNPGCNTATQTYLASAVNFGSNLVYTWYINNAPVLVPIDSIITHLFANGDVLTLKVYGTDRGCRNIDTEKIRVDSMIRVPVPASPLISLIGDLIVANSAGYYYWYKGNPYTGMLIPGATGQTYHPTVLGYYYAIKDTPYCKSAASNVLYVSLMGVNDPKFMGDVKISPNPTSGIVNLDWDEPVNCMVSVFSMVGQELLNDKIVDAPHHSLDLINMPNGSYLIVLSDDEGAKKTYRVTVQH